MIKLKAVLVFQSRSRLFYWLVPERSEIGAFKRGAAAPLQHWLYLVLSSVSECVLFGLQYFRVQG